ncbi:MAG: DUF2817 domain-containing protein [Alphaproteobacteria bacterium]|nr:DUF2817 domain-containing protein [Alphaproteobacteria bacterium]
MGRLMGASDYFSRDYSDARAKFHDAASAAGASLTAHLNPHVKGPGGEDLAMDVAVLGDPNAASALLVTSATHGVEGFAGSGVQIAMLKTGLAKAAAENLKVVLIHALNPYGFAWLRRVNEDNVDLNRNAVDHGAPHPVNAGYRELASAIAPREWGKGKTAAPNAVLRQYVQDNGAFALQEAISAGQYEFPDGLYFGGQFETWSLGTFGHVVRRAFPRTRNLVLLDVHTGLGARGALEMISEWAPESPAYRRARDWWGERVKTTATGESLSAHLSGTLDTFIPGLLPHAEVTPIALEYGTHPTEVIFHALRADNWLHQHADPQGPEAPAIKAEIRDAFYADADDWKTLVWQQAEDVIEATVKGLKA